jgi:hypothetical protein
MLETSNFADILEDTEWVEEARSINENIVEAKEEIEEMIETIEHACGVIKGFINLLEPAATDEELAEIEEAVNSLEKYVNEE